MSIDRLSSTASLIAALRAELVRKGEKPRRGGALGASRADPGGSSSRDVSALRVELAEILKDVPPDDEQAMNAARPRVVRAVLLWEFGGDLREYREWQPMLERLVETLQGDERHRSEFARLIRELRA